MTDDLSRPWDQHAERAVLGEVLHQATVASEIAERVDPLDFYEPKHQWIAEVCWDLTAKTSPCDPAGVLTELMRRKHLVDGLFLAGLLGSAFPMPTGHADTIRQMSVRRQVIVQATRAIQLASDLGTDPYDTAASMSVQAEQLATRSDIGSMPLTDVHDFLAGPTEYEWLVDGLLEHGDRLLLTGGEGSGKSVCLRQLAVCVAAGLHPFTGTHTTPRRVLLVDLENGTRHLRRALAPLVELAARSRRPLLPGMLHVESRTDGIDLTTPTDEAWLRAVTDTATPDLLVIGPLYRMHATDMGKEEPARHLTRVLDAIRSRHGCCIAVETHAGHGSGMGARDLRPVGSSLFRRWPEFGYGLRPENDEMAFVSWRGARDERAWPRKLQRGGEGRWPWLESNPYAHLRWHSNEDDVA